jgi:hypothetical protein
VRGYQIQAGKKGGEMMPLIEYRSHNFRRQARLSISTSQDKREALLKLQKYHKQRLAHIAERWEEL